MKLEKKSKMFLIMVICYAIIFASLPTVSAYSKAYTMASEGKTDFLQFRLGMKISEIIISAGQPNSGGWNEHISYYRFHDFYVLYPLGLDNVDIQYARGFAFLSPCKVYGLQIGTSSFQDVTDLFGEQYTKASNVFELAENYEQKNGEADRMGIRYIINQNELSFFFKNNILETIYFHNYNFADPNANLISIVVDYEYLPVSLAPVIEDDCCLIPVRDLAKGLALSIEWNAEESSVLLKNEEKQMQLFCGQTKIIADGREIVSPIPSRITEDRMFVPLRVVAEFFGKEVYFGYLPFVDAWTYPHIWITDFRLISEKEEGLEVNYKNVDGILELRPDCTTQKGVGLGSRIEDVLYEYGKPMSTENVENDFVWTYLSPFSPSNLNDSWRMQFYFNHSILNKVLIDRGSYSYIFPFEKIER